MLELKSKSFYEKIWGSMGVLSGGFEGGLKSVKMLKIWPKLEFLDAHIIPLSDFTDPKFCL